jgi:acyl-coenzyme A thioesterase PaaI-like protein
VKFPKPIQDYYPSETAICYGCGTNNPDGLHIKTHWDGDFGVCRFTPWDAHTAFPGVVYGGLIASLIDCHSIGTAIAAFYHRAGRLPDDGGEVITCVTGNLNVSYRQPTPHGKEIVLQARITELSDKKAVVTCAVLADGIETASGETIAVRVPSRMVQGGHYL